MGVSVRDVIERLLYQSGPVTERTPCLCGATQPAHYCTYKVQALEDAKAWLAADRGAVDPSEVERLRAELKDAWLFIGLYVCHAPPETHEKVRVKHREHKAKAAAMAARSNRGTVDQCAEALPDA